MINLEIDFAINLEIDLKLIKFVINLEIDF